MSDEEKDLKGSYQGAAKGQKGAPSQVQKEQAQPQEADKLKALYDEKIKTSQRFAVHNVVVMKAPDGYTIVAPFDILGDTPICLIMDEKATQQAKKLFAQL